MIKPLAGMICSDDMVTNSLHAQRLYMIHNVMSDAYYVRYYEVIFVDYGPIRLSADLVEDEFSIVSTIFTYGDAGHGT